MAKERVKNFFKNFQKFCWPLCENHDKVLKYQDRLFTLDAEIMGEIRKDALTFQSYKEKYQTQRLKYTRQIDTLIAKRKHISVQNKKTKKWPSKISKKKKLFLEMAQHELRPLESTPPEKFFIMRDYAQEWRFSIA